MSGKLVHVIQGEQYSDYELAAAEHAGYLHGNTVGAIVEQGEHLNAVRFHLEHGRWIPWLTLAGIHRQTAHKLMTIAQDAKLLRYRGGDVTPARHLPPSRDTLYELTKLSEEEFRALAEAEKINPEMKRAEVRAMVAGQRHATPPAPPVAPTDGRYGAILADPPWRFETRGSGARAAAERHYPTMELAEIELLPVMELAADDALLFLWVTSERLVDAPRIMVQWGFELVSTAFVWVKEGQPGLGYWTRKGAELCLLGKRGSPSPRAKDVAEVVHAPRGRHSEKPQAIYERIERLAAGPYLELFARSTRPGWAAWGNDPALAGGGA